MYPNVSKSSDILHQLRTIFVRKKMGQATWLGDPFALRHSAVAAYSAEGAPNWRDINQVRHIWQDIAQVLLHMRPILPFPPHLRHIVPDWLEGGRILCKCAAPRRNIAQVRRTGAAAAGQRAGEGAGLGVLAFDFALHSSAKMGQATWLGDPMDSQAPGRRGCSPLTQAQHTSFICAEQP